MTRLRVPERPLLLAVRLGVLLLVLTPLVVAPRIVYPFSVGKAVWSRSVIEIAFVLWAVLAAAHPAWRPPRSRLLLLLAAGLGVALLSACFGVSVQRSLWSTYLRMQGVLDQAHWFAAAVVAASVFRKPRDLRALLGFHLAVGLLVALVAVARSAGLEPPLFGWIPEPRSPRIAATLGNPTFLGAYLLVNVVLALGLLARSLIPAAGPRQGADGSRRSRRRGRGKPSAGAPARPSGVWPGRLFHGLSAAVGLWALGLSGSMAALAGLIAAFAALAAAYAVLGRTPRVRLAARAGAGLLGAGAVAAAFLLIAAPSLAPSFDNPLLRRATDPQTIERTMGRRFVSWEAGLAGFAERPVLGWGPANYMAPFGRHVGASGAELPTNDHAHNMLIEEAATKGLAGLAAYLAVWGLTFTVVLRAARGAEPREQAFALFTGAALLGQFVQSQALFGTASSALQHTLLMAVAVGLEASARPPDGGPRLPAAVAGRFRGGAARAGLVTAAAALCALGLASNRAIHAGAAALYRAETSGPARFMDELGQAVDAFGPLANGPRRILFENLAPNWPVLHAGRPAEAARLLAWADREAAAALEAEPANWEIHQSLARLYGTVAASDRDYAGRAEHHYRRALELAPGRDPLAPPPRPPRPPRGGTRR